MLRRFELEIVGENHLNLFCWLLPSIEHGWVGTLKKKNRKYWKLVSILFFMFHFFSFLFIPYPFRCSFTRIVEISALSWRSCHLRSRVVWIIWIIWFLSSFLRWDIFSCGCTSISFFGTRVYKDNQTKNVRENICS